MVVTAPGHRGVSILDQRQFVDTWMDTFISKPPLKASYNWLLEEVANRRLVLRGPLPR